MKSLKILLLLTVFTIVASISAVAGGRYFSDFNDLSEWSVDRYTPNLFEQVTFQNDYRLHIQVTADAAERGSQNGAFYNTHGKTIETNIPVSNANPAIISGKIYIPASWSSSHRRSDIWGATQIVGQTYLYYPIIGFANTTGANPTFRAWNSTDGWHNVNYAITYDTWYDLSISIEENQNKYYINGDLVYTEVLPTEDVQYNLKDIFVQGYNFGDPSLATESQSFNDDYDIYWDDIAARNNNDKVVNVTQTTTYENIQPAVNAATANDYLRVLEGTFVQTTTLNINKSLTIIGDSEAGCMIDVSAVNSPSYGIKVGASDVIIKNFTAIPNSVSGSYLFKVSDDISNITLENITANASKKTAFDFHAITNLTITNLTATNTVSGNAISLTGCTNVDITGVTSTNNAWGGIAVYCSKPAYYNRASSNVNFDFAANNVTDALYIQNEFGLVSTNINIDNWTYETANNPTTEYTYYIDGTLADAYGFATYLNTRLANTASVVRDNNSVHHVNTALSIQAAIDAAAPGNTILVEAGDYGTVSASNRNIFGTGNYQFGLFIDKPLSIIGLDAMGNPCSNPNQTAVTFNTAASNSFGSSGIFVLADNVTLNGLKIGDNYKNGVMDNNKTIEVIGNNFAITNCFFNTVANQGSLYFGEWDLTHPITHYSINNNIFNNALISLNNGVGKTGDVANRQITNNTFTGERNYYLISFRGWNGADPIQGWIVKPVGGAVITGNDFSGVTNIDDYISARGNLDGVIAGQLNWEQIWNQNTFGNKVIALSDYTNFVPAEMLISGYPNSVRINTNLQDNITLAPAGSTIKIGEGTYEEEGQLVIAKNLSFMGVTKTTTIIKTNQNTGNSGDARGWWLVNDGVELNLNNLTVDGDGYNIYQGIRHKGNGTINNVDFANIIYPNYAGTAIAAFGGDVDFTDCNFANIGRVGVLYFGDVITGSNFTNCTYTGKGIGDWLDYALDISAGAHINVENMTVSNNYGVASSDGSTSAGVLVSTYFGAGTQATITNSQINNNYLGIAVGYDANDVSNVTVSGCTLTNNDYAITSTAPEVDATGCNYFGTDIESEVDAMIEGDVNYIPFMLANGNCDGGKHVHNITQSLDYLTIQEAIAEANENDVIEVEAGEYLEEGQIVIDKNLTISGAGEDLTILKSDFTTSTSLYDTAAGWIYVASGVTFKINNVTLDGDTQTITTAIQSRGNTEVGNCTIKNIKSAKYMGLGVQFLSGNSNLVDNCKFINIERIGVHVRGNIETSNPIATVINSTFTGSGEGDFCQYGIEFGGGGQGTVENCVISDYISVESGWGSAGILVTDYYGTGTSADILTSTIRDNNVGVHVGYNETDLSIATVHNCDIINNIGYGVYSTSTNVDAKNNWWGDCSGPEVASNIDGLGDKLTENVDYYPWTRGDCSGYNVMVKLIDSENNPIPGQEAQIRDGSYITAITNEYGYVTTNISCYYTYVKMTHLGKTETKLGIFYRNPVLVFQTEEVTLNLTDSDGTPLNADELIYRDGNGTYVPLATNAASASIEMLPLAFDFQVKYLGFTQTLVQNVKTNQTVNFQTHPVTINLTDSDGSALNAEELAYRNVDGDYVSVAQDAATETLEMLLLSYYFQAKYLGFEQQLFQNTADDNSIEFQTQKVTVSLNNSTGNPLEAEELFYRDANKNYVSLGTNKTSDTLEMLPLSYYFKVKYLGHTLSKLQNVTSDASVDFQTVLVSFNLVDGSNSQLNGDAIYRDGYAIYNAFGESGQTPETMEMLPLYYYFRCTYNGMTKTKLWNVNADSNVLFTFDGSNLFKQAEAGDDYTDWSGISTRSYPTPFNSVLNIEYIITTDADLTIEIFDISGRKVKTLENTFASQGSYTTKWDGTSDNGQSLESGTYYYVITAGEDTQTGKIVLVK